ncbi:DUF6349 family protein [Brevibacterium pityocampae]
MRRRYRDSCPPEWEISGAPVRTLRKLYCTRHVPAYSAWGGCDLAVLPSLVLSPRATTRFRTPVRPSRIRPRGDRRRLSRPIR